MPGLTRIVSDETNGNPAAFQQSHGVPQRWIHQVEVLRITGGIVVPESGADNIETVSVQVERVVVQKIHVDVLQDDLHRLVILQRQRFGSPLRRQVVLRHHGGRREIENLRRVRREVRRVHPFLLVVVGFQNGAGGRDVEGHIVEGGSNLRPCRAIFGRRAHNVCNRGSKNKAAVRGAGEVVIRQPKEAFREVVCQVRIINKGKRWHDYRGF